MKTTKKLLTLMTLLLTLMVTQSFTNDPGKVIIQISIEVNNYEEWKKSFDAGAPIREKAGISVLSIWRDMDNQNQITVIEEAESAQKANEFLTMLKEKQKTLGISKIEVKMYNKAELN